MFMQSGNKLNLHVPEQDVPEPWKPDLQAHVKAPFVLMQLALA